MNFKSAIRRGVALSVAAVLGLSLAVWAADGDLDLTFGDEGKVLTDISGPSSLPFSDLDVLDSVVQLNGKFIAAGAMDEWDDGENASFPVFFARFSATGQKEFGGILGLGAGRYPDGVVVSPVTGQVFVFGGEDTQGFYRGFARAYTIGQSAVTENGTFVLPGAISDQNFCATAMVDSSGKLVLGCLRHYSGGTNNTATRAALVRVNPSTMTIDTSFGNQGVAEFPTQPAGGCADIFETSAIAQDASGNYVGVATCSTQEEPTELSTAHVFKVSSTGVVTTSGFGTNGLFQIPIAGSAEVEGEAAVFDSAGRLYVGGEDDHHSDTCSDSKNYIAKINLQGAGSLDTTWGTNGIFTHAHCTNPDLGYEVETMKFQPDGKMLVVGGNALYRLNANGTRDTSFVPRHSYDFNLSDGYNSLQWGGLVLTDGGTRAVVVGGVDAYCVRFPADCGNPQNLAENIGTAYKFILNTDSTPEPFTFTAQTGVTRSAQIVSNIITVQGIDDSAPISIVAGSHNSSQYSINCDEFSFTNIAGTVGLGDTVCVRHTSSSIANTTRTTTLNIGGVTGTFSATTADVDTTPNNFTFTAQTGVPLDTDRTSNTVTITGLEAAASISIAGSGNPRYDIGCNGGATSTAGTINNNDTVCVILRSASSPQIQRQATLNIGGVSGAFSVTTGDAAVIALSPTSLTYTSRPVGTTSSSQAVTITNNGSVALTGVTVGITGDFAQAHSCTTVAAGGTCAINVTFSPTANGTRTGTLTVNGANNFGGAQTASLTGTGTAPAPAISFSPSSISFGSREVGTSSTPTAVTLTNDGTASLTISSIASTNGSFTQTNNCPTGVPVAVGNSCTINVTFSPASSGTLGGSIQVVSNTTAGTDSLTVSGTGTAPVANLSVNSLNLGSQRVGTTSSQQTFTLTNGGTATMTITGIAISGANAGQFTKSSDNCPSSLAVGANCTVGITFSPTGAAGARIATVTVTTNGNDPTVALSGTATASSVSLSPASIAFGNVGGGSTGTQQLTVTNNGTAPLNISAKTTAPSPEFTTDNGCASAVAPSASCVIVVTFAAPAANLGARTGTLTLTSDAASSPTVINLSGTSVAPGISLSPSSLNFGSRRVGTSSAALSTTVTNTGTSSLTVSNVTVTGADASNFVRTNNCSAALNPGGTCTISVVFTPSALGARAATLNVISNAPNSPTTLALSGTGTAPQATLSTSTLAFGNVVTSANSTLPVTVTNSGNALLTVSTPTISGAPYSIVSQDCSSQTLAAGGTCTINVRFSPTALGAASGTLTVNSDDGTGAKTVTLSGNGVAPGINATPGSLSFGNVLVGVTTAPQTVTVSNNGTAALTVNTPTLSGANANNFAIGSNGCTASVAPNGTCTITVTFTPSATGARSATLTIPSAAGNRTVSLGGTGAAPVLNVTPTSLGFGNQPQGEQSAAQVVTVSNSGTFGLSINSVSLGGTHAADFVAGGTCTAGAVVAPSSSCTVNVRFTPAGTGNRTATLTVNTTAGTPVVVNLSGRGLSSDDAPNGVNVATTQGTISPVTAPASTPAANRLPAGYSVTGVGYFSFTITLPTGEDSTNVIFTLPAGNAADSYVKCPPGGGVCNALPATRNGNQLIVRLRDGVTGEDADGTVNGVIVDPGAPAIAPAVEDSGGSMGWGVLLLGLPALLRRRRMH